MARCPRPRGLIEIRYKEKRSLCRFTIGIPKVGLALPPIERRPLSPTPNSRSSSRSVRTEKRSECPGLGPTVLGPPIRYWNIDQFPFRFGERCMPTRRSKNDRFFSESEGIPTDSRTKGAEILDGWPSRTPTTQGPILPIETQQCTCPC